MGCNGNGGTRFSNLEDHPVRDDPERTFARPQAVVSAKSTRHVEKMARIFKCAKGASAAGSGLIMLKITLDWLDRLLSLTAWG